MATGSTARVEEEQSDSESDDVGSLDLKSTSFGLRFGPAEPVSDSGSDTDEEEAKKRTERIKQRRGTSFAPRGVIAVDNDDDDDDDSQSFDDDDDSDDGSYKSDCKADNETVSVTHTAVDSNLKESHHVDSSTSRDSGDQTDSTLCARKETNLEKGNGEEQIKNHIKYSQPEHQTTKESGSQEFEKSAKELGTQKPVKSTNEAGSQDHVTLTTESGYQEPVKSTKESGSQDHVKSTTESGYQECVKSTKESGFQDHVKLTAESGYQECVKSTKESGSQDHVKSTTESASSKPVKSTKESGSQTPLKQESGFQDAHRTIFKSNDEGLIETRSQKGCIVLDESHSETTETVHKEKDEKAMTPTATAVY